MKIILVILNMFYFHINIDSFSGRPADYFFLLIFNWICCVIIGLLANIPVNHLFCIMFLKLIRLILTK